MNCLVLQQPQQQKQLREAAAELAKQLAALAAKDGRIGSKMNQAMENALAKMKAALEQWEKEDAAGALASGEASVFDLNTVASLLAKILELDQQMAETSSEEYPSEYATAIRDYLRRLSYAE